MKNNHFISKNQENDVINLPFILPKLVRVDKINLRYKLDANLYLDSLNELINEFLIDKKKASIKKDCYDIILVKYFKSNKTFLVFSHKKLKIGIYFDVRFNKDYSQMITSNYIFSYISGKTIYDKTENGICNYDFNFKKRFLQYFLKEILDKYLPCHDEFNKIKLCNFEIKSTELYVKNKRNDDLNYKVKSFFRNEYEKKIFFCYDKDKNLKNSYNQSFICYNIDNYNVKDDNGEYTKFEIKLDKETLNRNGIYKLKDISKLKKEIRKNIYLKKTIPRAKKFYKALEVINNLNRLFEDKTLNPIIKLDIILTKIGRAHV